MRKISTREHFRDVAVFEGPGPVYRIEFRNPEQTNALVNFIVIVLAGLAVFPITTYGERFSRVSGIHWGVWPALAVGLLVAAFIWRWPGKKVKRAIEMDYASDRLRVLRNGRVKIDRKLSTLQDLTLGEHPQAEIERRKRPGAIGQFQKQHCLIGWFGVRGSEQVQLLCRLEWPNRNSLLEVQQAYQWVRSIRRPSMGLAPADDDEQDEVAASGRHGLHPPLD